ncbi:unnamed protein product [Caretta caretta]
MRSLPRLTPSDYVTIGNGGISCPPLSFPPTYRHSNNTAIFLTHQLASRNDLRDINMFGLSSGLLRDLRSKGPLK